jgi:hypothetical protein
VIVGAALEAPAVVAGLDDVAMVGRMIIIEVFERGATPRHRPTRPVTLFRIDTS